MSSHIHYYDRGAVWLVDQYPSNEEMDTCGPATLSPPQQQVVEKTLNTFGKEQLLIEEQWAKDVIVSDPWEPCDPIAPSPPQQRATKRAFETIEEESARNVRPKITDKEWAKDVIVSSHFPTLEEHFFINIPKGSDGFDTCLDYGNTALEKGQLYTAYGCFYMALSYYPDHEFALEQLTRAYKVIRDNLKPENKENDIPFQINGNSHQSVISTHALLKNMIRGNYFFHQEKYQNALIHFRNALDSTVNKDNLLILRRLAKSHRALNQFAEAVYYYERIFKIDPRDEEANKVLQQIQLESPSYQKI